MDEPYYIFEWYQANDLAIGISFPGVDLTGSTILLTAKKVLDTSATDANAPITKSYSVASVSTDPTTGTAVLPLTSSEMNIPAGSYFIDVKAILGSGAHRNLPTFKLIIKQPVTNRSA